MRHLLLVLRLTLLCGALLSASAAAATPGMAQDQGTGSAPVAGWWAQVLRPTDMWSGPGPGAESFGQLPRGHYVFVPDAQPYPGSGRVYVREAAENAYGYVDAIALAPSGPPPGVDGAGTSVSVVGAPLFQPFWVANHTAATLWATPNDGAEALLDLPAFTKMLVLAPAAGQRYYVQEARSERLGYVDAHLIGPSDPPLPGEFDPPPSLTPPVVAAFKPSWVVTVRQADLWSGMTGGTSFGRVPAGEHLLMMAPPSGPRLHILNPKTKNYAFVNAADVTPSNGPKPASIEVRGWQGVITGDIVNLRPEPNTFVPHVAQARAGDDVTVSVWAEGEELNPDNRTWAKVTSIKRRDFAGQLVELLTPEHGQPWIYSALLRPATLSAPPERPQTALGNGGARWIDVNLTHQTVVAYEGERAVFFERTTSGRPGWETPVGTHRIQRRVENETMVGSTLLRLDTHEIPDYRLENVKWTQYFTGSGAALHTNYWRPASLFGMPSSHGCLGLLERHAKWLWDWARVGTPLLVHY